jgi:hypothetical protein
VVKWVKGQSGNPSGRPKMGELRDLCRAYTEEAVKKLGELINHNSPRIAMLAIRELLDRGYGKPLQSVDVALDDARESVQTDYRGPLLPDEVAREISALLTNAERTLGLVELPNSINEERVVRLRQNPEGLPPPLYAALQAGMIH